MTANIDTFDDLQAKMYFALGGTRFLKAANQANAAFRVLKSSWSLSVKLRVFLKKLATVKWESVPVDIISDTEKLHSSLLEVVAEMRERVNKNPVYNYLFHDIEKSTGELEDILENYHLFMNKDFNDLLEGAVKGIKEGERHPDWRSSLAKM